MTKPKYATPINEHEEAELLDEVAQLQRELHDALEHAKQLQRELHELRASDERRREVMEEMVSEREQLQSDFNNLAQCYKRECIQNRALRNALRKVL